MTGGQILVQSAMRALSISGLPRIVARQNAGIGCILAMHRIHRPASACEVGTTRTSLSPDNFRQAIATLLGEGYEFVTMSGVAERLAGGRKERKFACLTFDDGFADSYSEAFPICRSFGVPMVVYLISGVVKRSVSMWWLGLDRIVAEQDVVEFDEGGETHAFFCATPLQKRQTYFRLANWFVEAAPRDGRAACERLGARYDVDFNMLTDRHALTVENIREMQASGLVEFGAHTVNHPNLRSLSDREAIEEIVSSVRDIETIVGRTVRHFAFPYGGGNAVGSREIAMARDAGLQTAVTTRMATVFRGEPLHALPRLTLNGDYQGAALLELLTSGMLPKLRQTMSRPSRSAT